MKIRIITPAPPRSRKGNRVTALRWSRLLSELGHRVTIEQGYDGADCDVLVALHARRSYPAIAACRRRRPEIPLIVALTGTDLYGDIRISRRAQQSLRWATRIVLLQPLGMNELPARFRSKARVILQSAEPPATRAVRRTDRFEVCVIGHLRPVKDPFRAALAARRLPASSEIKVVHFGAALTDAMRRRAIAESAVNGRYQWRGERPRRVVLRWLARSRLLVLSSKLEGGANVISEALAAGVPILASHIPGSVGLLGPDYPGYFRVGDTQGLAGLLERAETDRAFYRRLARACRRLAPLVTPRRERETWRRLLAELLPTDFKALGPRRASRRRVT